VSVGESAVAGAPLSTRGVAALQRFAGNRAATGLATRRERGAPRLQRFGIADRQWGQVTKLTHLGADAYELSTDGGESLVLKLAGQGRNDYQQGDPGPIEEGLAANLGGIAEIGVSTAGTVMVDTTSLEGQSIIVLLEKLGQEGLADGVAKAQVVLVMERAPGKPGDKAQDLVSAQSPTEQATIFYQLGRLWAFDALLHNTDRFLMGNWGNVIIGSQARVTGIDQMVGLNASDMGAQVEMGLAVDHAKGELAKVLDGSKGMALATGTVDRLTSPASEDLRDVLSRHFLRGALDGVLAIGDMNPERMRAQLDTLPEFAKKAAFTLGLGGAFVIQDAFARSAEAVVLRQTELLAETLPQIKLSAVGVLQLCSGLAAEWRKVNDWWTGKDAHWRERKLKVAIPRAVAHFRSLCLMLNSGQPDPDLIFLTAGWREPLDRLSRIATVLPEGITHEAIKAPIHEMTDIASTAREKLKL
jgi:hypothetical protein